MQIRICWESRSRCNKSICTFGGALKEADVSRLASSGVAKQRVVVADQLLLLFRTRVAGNALTNTGATTFIWHSARAPVSASNVSDPEPGEASVETAMATCHVSVAAGSRGIGNRTMSKLRPGISPLTASEAHGAGEKLWTNRGGGDSWASPWINTLSVFRSMQISFRTVAFRVKRNAGLAEPSV